MQEKLKQLELLISRMVTRQKELQGENDALKAENDSLKKQVTDLTKQLESAQADVKENKELKSMLGVSERNTSFSYEQAQVIGRTLDEWSSVLTIDAGSKDGLEKHDCVVTSQGMVGYISDLSDHTAQVTTIIDKNMSAGALVTRTGEIGVAAGDYKLMSDGKLKVSYLSKDADVVVDVGDVALYVVNLLLSLPYLGVEHHEVLQTLLHVGLIGTKGLLLLSYFLLHLRALVLQTANGGVGVAGCAFLVLAIVPGSLPALGFLRTFSCRVVARRGSGALALCCCRACDRGLLL